MSMINNEIQCANNEAKISTREHDTNDQNDHESVASVIDLTNDSEVDSEDDSSVIDLVSDSEVDSQEDCDDDEEDCDDSHDIPTFVGLRFSLTCD